MLSFPNVYVTNGTHSGELHGAIVSVLAEDERLIGLAIRLSRNGQTLSEYTMPLTLQFTFEDEA